VKKEQQKAKCEISSDRYEGQSCIIIRWDHSSWTLACECIYFECKKRGENSQSGTCTPEEFTLIARKPLNPAELHIMLGDW